jgi:hypothetical protein
VSVMAEPEPSPAPALLREARFLALTFVALAVMYFGALAFATADCGGDAQDTVPLLSAPVLVIGALVLCPSLLVSALAIALGVHRGARPASHLLSLRFAVFVLVVRTLTVTAALGVGLVESLRTDRSPATATLDDVAFEHCSAPRRAPP